MKQLLKRITAFLACAAMFSSSAAMQANAWGLRDTGSVIPKETWEDRGMLADIFGLTGEYYIPAFVNRNDELGAEYVYDHDQISVGAVVPCRNSLMFRLRSAPEEKKVEETAKRVLTVIRKYYPDAAQSYDAPVAFHEAADPTYLYPSCFYMLRDNTETAGSAEIADALMHDLAAEGLISEFYSWGETAYYEGGDLGYTRVDGQYACQYTVTVNDDLDALEQYLTAHDLNCTMQFQTDEWDEWGHRTLYVILNGKRTFRDLFDVAEMLYDEFGYRMWITIYPVASRPRLGQNALALTGDVDLDCSVDVADAVLTARYIAEDSEAVLTECGTANADTDGDGSVTTDDVTLLLQYIAKKTS